MLNSTTRDLTGTPEILKNRPETVNNNCIYYYQGNLEVDDIRDTRR